VLDSLESRDLSTDVLVVVVGGITCTGGACTTTWAGAATGTYVVESTSLVLLPHPATQAKAATPTTLIAIRWIEFISLVLPRTLGREFCE
jgi:hypothetical protein